MPTRTRLAMLALALSMAISPAADAARRRPPHPAPPPVVEVAVTVPGLTLEPTFFGIPLRGAEDVVFVLDRSGSMTHIPTGVAASDLGLAPTRVGLVGGLVALGNKIAGDPLPTKLDAAKEELARALTALPDGTRFGIVFFNDQVRAFTPGLQTLDPTSREDALLFIDGIEAEGSTAAVPALRVAYEAGARRVVLLSDGLANTGGDGGDLLVEARAAMAAGVRFDTVGVGFDQDADLLRSLAAESGGYAVVR